MKDKNTKLSGKNEVVGKAENPAPPRLEDAECENYEAAAAKIAPANAEQGGEVSAKHTPASSIETIVNILASKTDGAKPFTGNWKEVFLQALARVPIVSVAAAIAGVSRRRAMEERSADAGFARRWDDAAEEGVDEIEAAVFLSAVYGERKPVFYQGQQTGWTVEYSHAMRSMLLKAWRPEVFAEKDDPETPRTKVMTLEAFRERVQEAKARASENPFA